MIRKVVILALGVGVQGLVTGCSSTGVQSSAVGPTPSGTEVSFTRDVSPLLNTYCTGCHSGPNAPEGVNLSFASEEEVREKAMTDDEFWSRVVRNASSGQMPPPYAPRKPSDAERTVLVDWINNNLLTSNGMPDPGPFIVRRLNNREYANTVRDLLYLPADYDIAADFPADERGDGFDNNAATLTISPLLIEHYLEAAEEATTTALALDPPSGPIDPGVRDTISSRRLINNPSAGVASDYADRVALVRLNMETMAPRAFRRPVTAAEVDSLMKFASISFTHSGLSDQTFDEATALATRAALLSPEFLFRIENDPNADGTGKVFELTEYQLASRLSYFLWSTMPDDSLFMVARNGALRTDLETQINRMLQDPRAISLTKDFLGQWLEIRGLDHVSNTTPQLLASMQGETEHFFDYIVRNNRSIMEFLDADYTFLNEDLATLYGIPGITGPEFRRVQVDRARRGGIFTQASFLALTAKPLGSTLRTSPVMRGKWILENIFNETIPPPPPNVPSLNIDQNVELKGTVRQIFEQHRADPVCAGCHARMDPYGFALENYDGYGRWREQDNGVNVDASGTINGKSFTTPTEFRAILADRQDDFRIALVRKMLSYALGRGIQASDRQTIQQIADAVKADGDSFSSLILNIARSYPFQFARAPVASDASVLATTTDEAPVLFHPVKFAEEMAAKGPGGNALGQVTVPQAPEGQGQGRQGQGQGQGQAPAQGQGEQGQGQGQRQQRPGQNAAQAPAEGQSARPVSPNP